MQIFTVKIYNADESSLLATLEAGQVGYVREKNKPDVIRFTLPRVDTDKQHLELGNIARIYDRDQNLVTEGIISGPLDKSQDPIPYFIYTIS